VIVVLLVGVTALGTFGHGWLHDASVPRTEPADAATAEHRFIVPFGTAERAAAGETLNLVPRTLVILVGESVAVVNEDVAPAQVGPFSVGPGQSVAMRFTEVGTFGGSCTVHAEGRFDVEVREA
jgi:plastocyanin